MTERSSGDRRPGKGSSGPTHNRPRVKGDFAPPLFHRGRMGKVSPRSRWLLSWVVRAQSQ